MYPNPHAEEGPVEPVFTALADGRRRQLLATLDERSGSTTIPELARALPSRGTATTPATPSPREHRSIRTSLHHVHVPKLVEAGLLERTGDEVVLAETAIGRRAARLVDAPVAEQSLDEAFEVLAHRDRRAAVATLRKAGEPLAVTEVAAGVHERSSADRSTQALAVSLGHLHLPKLDEGDVIDYDRSEEEVAFDGFPLACQEVLECMTGRLARRRGRRDEPSGPDDRSGVAERRLLELPRT